MNLLVFNVLKWFAVSDPENLDASYLQRKLEMFNSITEQDTRADQARRQMQYFGHCKYIKKSHNA